MRAFRLGELYPRVAKSAQSEIEQKTRGKHLDLPFPVLWNFLPSSYATPQGLLVKSNRGSTY